MAFAYVGKKSSAATRWCFLLVSAALAHASAQTPATSESPASPSSGITNPDAPQPGNTAPAQDNRIFGVLPNYRTADSTKPFVPLTTQQKFHIAVKDSFDWPGFILAGLFSGLYQWEDQNPSFGQGIKGYAHRYVTSYADQVAGNMLTEAILPSILREDPRYFRLVHGTKLHRTGYALSRILVTRTDSGRSTFNVAEVLGNGMSASLGNAYYPDERGLGDTLGRMGTAIATDAISNVLKEFWPDIKRHLFSKHASADAL